MTNLSYEKLSTIFNITSSPVLQPAEIDYTPHRKAVAELDVVDTNWRRGLCWRRGSWESSEIAVSVKSSSDSLVSVRVDGDEEILSCMADDVLVDFVGEASDVDDDECVEAVDCALNESARTFVNLTPAATPLPTQPSTPINSKLTSEIITLQQTLRKSLVTLTQSRQDFQTQLEETRILAQYTANLRSMSR